MRYTLGGAHSQLREVCLTYARPPSKYEVVSEDPKEMSMRIELYWGKSGSGE